MSDPMDADINDIFDSIVLSEERLSEQGYKEGLLKGSTDGEIDGFHMGYHQGAQIGAELGYYTGVLKAVLVAAANKNLTLPDVVAGDIIKLLHLLENFPRTNSREEDILALRDSIKAKYRKICSLMKINSPFSEFPSVSF